MLPENERNLAFELIKRIFIAWNPEYTKLTPTEAESLKETESSGYIDIEEIDWNNLEKYQ